MTAIRPSMDPADHITYRDVAAAMRTAVAGRPDQQPRTPGQIVRATCARYTIHGDATGDPPYIADGVVIRTGLYPTPMHRDLDMPFAVVMDPDGGCHWAAETTLRLRTLAQGTFELAALRDVAEEKVLEQDQTGGPLWAVDMSKG